MLPRYSSAQSSAHRRVLKQGSSLLLNVIAILPYVASANSNGMLDSQAAIKQSFNKQSELKLHFVFPPYYNYIMWLAGTGILGTGGGGSPYRAKLKLLQLQDRCVHLW